MLIPVINKQDESICILCNYIHIFLCRFNKKEYTSITFNL